MAESRPVKQEEQQMNNLNGQPIVRSRIWFDDTRIVVQAERTHFCVFRKALSTLSPVFKEMLANLPSEGVERIDGCCILHLSDSAKDVEKLLDVLTNASYFQKNDLQPFEKVSVLLRLGAKYKIKTIRDGAVSCIQAHCEEFREERKRRKLPFQCEWAGIENFDTPSCLVDVLNLARQMGGQSVLSDLFVRCAATLSTEQIVKGVRREDGSLAVLSPEDQMVCFTGRDRLRASQMRTFYAWLDEDQVPSPSCSTVQCSRLKAKQAAKMFAHFQLPPLTVRGKLDVSPSALIPDLCGACSIVALESIIERYRRLHEMIPSFFDLPAWESLSLTTTG